MTDLTPETKALLRQAETPGFGRWLAMVKATGGCSHPIRLVGETTTINTETGEVLSHFLDCGRAARLSPRGVQEPPRERLSDVR